MLKSPVYANPAVWAENCRVITGKFSSRPGKWNHENSPYLKEILEELGNPDVSRVVFMAASQVGKSEIMINALCWSIDCDPGPVMIVQPTQDDCRAWSRGRLRDAFDSAPTLNDKIPKANSRRDGTATTLEIQFGGGALYLAHAGSSSALSSKPIRWLLADEVDRYPDSSSGEGSPLGLAETRTQTYSDKKVFIASSPSIHGVSKIESEYLSGNQKEWWCQCESCDEWSLWDFANVVFEERKPETAKLTCKLCGSIFDQSAVRRMSAKGEWRAGTDAPARTDTSSYRIWAIHSQTLSMEEIVRKFLAAKGTPSELQVFTNTVLAETWQLHSQTMDKTDLLQQCDSYTVDNLPEGAYAVILTVDVQNNRLEYYLSAWGANEEHYGIILNRSRGDPSNIETWAPIFDLAANRVFTTVDGRELKVVAVSVDLGYRQDLVVKALKTLYTRIPGVRIYGLRGSSDIHSPIIGKKYGAASKKLRRNDFSESFYVGVNAIKDLIEYRVSLPADEGGWSWGLGFDEAYFEQFTSEHKEYKQGRDKKPRGMWVKKHPGASNEALDLAVYSYATLKLLNPNWPAVIENAKTHNSKRFPTKTKNIPLDEIQFAGEPKSKVKAATKKAAASKRRVNPRQAWKNRRRR